MKLPRRKPKLGRRLLKAVEKDLGPRWFNLSKRELYVTNISTSLELHGEVRVQIELYGPGVDSSILVEPEELIA